MFRRILYVSTSAPGGQVDLDPIFEQSRHNNAIDGVTGLLFSDGYRFLQVLEGGEEAVTATMARIAADPRHRDMQLLLDDLVEEREFGHWSMADRRRGEQARTFESRLRELLWQASPAVRQSFLDLLD